MPKKIIFLIFIVLALIVGLSAQAATVKGKIIEVNQQYNFVVVNLGEKDDLVAGSVLQVLRANKEIAKLGVIKLRPTICAAEIRELKTQEQLKIEDAVVFTTAEKKKEVKPEKVKEKKVRAKPPLKEKIPPSKQLTADVKAAPTLVFDAANILLRDRGFIVTVANREGGILVASKGLLLSRWEEVWAGLRGAIDHEAVFSLKIQEKAKESHLEISLSAGYLKKDQYRKRIIKDNSYIYREAADLMAEIKNWTEGLAGATTASEKKTPKDL